eukprot:3402252-Pleurochrysis_carterae.AAC.2
MTGTRHLSSQPFLKSFCTRAKVQTAFIVTEWLNCAKERREGNEDATCSELVSMLRARTRRVCRARSRDPPKITADGPYYVQSATAATPRTVNPTSRQEASPDP